MNYLSVGKIVAAFGVQGELVLRHALGKKTSLKGLETIFIEVKKGEFLPYFLTDARARANDEVLLSLEGIDTREKAMFLNQKQVWLEEKDFKRFAAPDANISFLGYQVVNRPDAGGEEELGEILEVIEQPHQVLCRIDLAGKEALLPIHEGTLLSADPRKKRLYLCLPDGLLDLYR